MSLSKSRPLDSSLPVDMVTAYAPKMRVSVDFSHETPFGRTKQSHKSECDVNQILAKYQRTGILEFTSNNEPRYDDVTGLDFQSAMQTVASANSLFAQMPSSLRKRFENDPAKFLNFVDDPKNYDEAVKIGLVTPPKLSGGGTPRANAAEDHTPAKAAPNTDVSPTP